MIILVYIILGITAIQFVTVVINLVFRQELKFNDIKENPLVSVLIPARNEENNIIHIIEDIRKQTYKNIEIIVFDDSSTDNTAHIVLEKAKTDKRIQLIQSTKLPEKWLGKNWACHNLAQKANGEYFLFLDADVRIEKDTIQKALAFAQNFKLSLLSVFPKQFMRSTGEKLTVPLMHYILLTLLPLILVRLSPFSSHSAANGQFMLFQAKNYHKYSPHSFYKSEKVEDILISRYYKSNKVKIACITGTDKITCRMYTNIKEAINGFSKNIVMLFGNSLILTILFWFITTFGWLPVLMFDVPIFMIYLLLYLLIIVFTSLTAKQNVIENVLLCFPQKIVMAIIIAKSLNRNKQWKGRSV